VGRVPWVRFGGRRGGGRRWRRRVWERLSGRLRHQRLYNIEVETVFRELWVRELVAPVADTGGGVGGGGL
jgi:hypothetical protein